MMSAIANTTACDTPCRACKGTGTYIVYYNHPYGLKKHIKTCGRCKGTEVEPPSVWERIKEWWNK